MKIIKLLSLMLLLPFFLIAQNIDIGKDGTVKVDGKEAFKIDGKQGMVNTSFSVYNLDGDLLISADGRSENNVMTVTFSGYNSSLDYPLTIGTRKMFVKDIAKMQVIKDGALNIDGIKRFVAKYNGRSDRDMLLTEGNTRNTIVVETRPNLVNRNRSSNIFISNKIIKQDFKNIGKISSRSAIEGGKNVSYFTITDMEDIHIAEVSKSMGNTQIDVVTYDNRRFSFHSKTASINNIALQDLIVEELIKRGIL